LIVQHEHRHIGLLCKAGTKSALLRAGAPTCTNACVSVAAQDIISKRKIARVEMEALNPTVDLDKLSTVFHEFAVSAI